MTRPPVLSALPPLRTPVAAVLAIAIVIGAAVPATMSVVSAQTGETASSDKLDEAAVERQRSAIKSEIAALGAHPWAGNYYEGDGLGANIAISLSPHAGIAATWRGCLGLYGANRGKVIEQGGALRFAYDRPNAREFGEFPDAVHPVAWGQRRYLIPESRMMAFVNAMHHGFEPRTAVHGMFLLAEGDEARPADGVPDLPPKYRGLLLAAPIEARVGSVELVEKSAKHQYGCNYRYRLTLDRGQRDGLVPELELSALVPDNIYDRAKIVATQERSSTAMLSFWADDCEKPKKVPSVAWRFTTGAYEQTRNAKR